MDVHVTKTVPIEFRWVVEAYRKVRQGGKGSGIDKESWTDFEKESEKNCYIIWTRMASGSYHPKAVRTVEIPKKDGTKRKLGIPTLRDRIAQEVVREYMEKRIDKQFHKNSYGYRPMKSAHDALRVVQQNCYRKDWVIDMDISKFFDEIDHELMLKAVEHIMPEEKWVKMYVKRWLEMPEQDEAGEIKSREGKGTPQGGVISPLLANLYLHYTLDLWLSRTYPEVMFVRYADDVVVHCSHKSEAEEVLEAIKRRLEAVKLQIKESKTRIVYCKDYRRRMNHKDVKFEFLGFSFQPISMKSKQEEGKYFTGYGGRPSSSNIQKMTDEIRKAQVFKNTGLEIKEIAEKLNSKIRGWINYFGLFNKYALSIAMYKFDYRLIKWMKQKHKLGLRKAIAKLKEIKQNHPKLFYHWEVGVCLKLS